MASTPTTTTLFELFEKSELDKPCCDLDLANLANEIVEWEKLAPFLGIKEAGVHEIKNDHPSYWQQKYNALLKWKQRNGRNATKRKIVHYLIEYGGQDVIPKFLSSQEKGPLEIFTTYLKQCYQEQQPPSANQWPATDSIIYIAPTLILVETAGTGEKYTPIDLSNIFTTGISLGKRTFVLLDGLAGAGKSTLVWHASQEWAKGELFHNLDLLITISLANPAVRSASTLTDLIPHPSKQIREAVASYISEKQGDKVAIVFDGLDLIPPQEQKCHYITELLKGSPGTALPKATILVTSRPEGSKGFLRLFSSRIRLLGFTNEEQIVAFFFKSLALESEVENFFHLKARSPVVLGMCSLPINAAIIAYLLSVPGLEIPTTRTELYRYFLLNLLLRHIQERTEHSYDSLDTFEELPENLAPAFKRLCKLAWNGILQCKAILTKQDVLKAGSDPQQLDGLGVIHQKQTLSATGLSSQYTFFHQSIQEYLAAVHLSTFSAAEQIKTAVELMKKNPSALVLPFLVGSTHNHSLVQLLCDNYIGEDSKDSSMHGHAKHMISELNQGKTSITKMGIGESVMQLFYCMFESQSPDVCAILTNKLSTQRRAHLFFPPYIDRTICTSVGYYLANCFSEYPPLNQFEIDLRGCIMGDLGVWAMVQQFLYTAISQHQMDFVPFFGLELSLYSAGITHIGTQTICRLLKIPSRLFITNLNLTDNWHPSTTDIGAALRVLIESVASYEFPIDLELNDNCLTAQYIWYLVLILHFCRGHLDISRNRIGCGIPLVAAALENNANLTSLGLSKCHITSKGLVALGNHLQKNNTLKVIGIGGNPFSPSALTTFLQLLKGNNRIKLLFLCLTDLTSEHKSVVEDINKRRSQSNTPTLKLQPDPETLSVMDQLQEYILLEQQVQEHQAISGQPA